MQCTKQPDPPELIEKDGVIEAMNLQHLRETSLPYQVNLMLEYACDSPLHDMTTLTGIITPSDDDDGNDVTDSN